MRENLLYLASRQDHRQFWRLFGTFYFFQPADFMFEDFFVEKKQRAQRLVLGRGCDVKVACKMSQKFGDFLLGHFSRVSFAVVDDEALDPVDVSLLGTDAVMFAADDVPHLVEQFWFARGRRSHYPL